MAKLTSLQAASPVSLFPTQESDEEKVTSDFYGRRCLEQLKKFPRVGLWRRMLLDFLILKAGWSFDKCVPIWKLKGTKCSQLLFQLAPLAHRTGGNVFGLLPTPSASEGERAGMILKDRRRTYRRSGTKRQLMLRDMAASGLLPTPTASLAKDGHSGEGYGDDLNRWLQRTGETSPRLNPAFVEEMMGFPLGWTVSAFQNGDAKQ